MEFCASALWLRRERDERTSKKFSGHLRWPEEMHGGLAGRHWWSDGADGGKSSDGGRKHLKVRSEQSR